MQGTRRGLDTQSAQKTKILDAVESLQDIGKDSVTTGQDIDGTWKMLWTTEKVIGSCLRTQDPVHHYSCDRLSVMVIVVL